MRIALIYIFLLIPLTLGAVSKREMRGTWIATVANTDWPVPQGTDSETQKKNMVEILDNAVNTNLNTIIFQIRPTADALYNSSFEPWSHWITGEQGMHPGYDPLQFVIDECDKRGLAVHVWINPYRVWLDKANISNAVHSDHPYNKHRNRTLTYGKTVMFNPADKEVREYVCSIVGEIVRNYDIDAVHMDDYFYPYRIAGERFPDDAEFKSDPRGFKNIEDWRRDNVDLIVKQIADTIKSNKPWVEFGISPFGVWRNSSVDPEGSDTRAGQTNYDDLYADILKWEREKWIDYVAPQIYWHIGYKIADYKVIAEWWNKNAYGTPLYTGNALYRIDPKSSTTEWRNGMEIVRQIKLNRSLENIGGAFLYSSKFLADGSLRNLLTENVFTVKSIVPENDRIKPIDAEKPECPVLNFEYGYVVFNWEPMTNNKRFVIYRFAIDGEDDFDDPSNILMITGGREARYAADADETYKYRYAITALSPTHKESIPEYFCQM